MQKSILKSDIEIAQKNCVNGAEAARYLNISYNTYKKWAKRYGIFEVYKKDTERKPRPYKRSQSIKKTRDARDYLESILVGKSTPHGKQNRWRVKENLMRFGLLKAKCNMCGFEEERITDRRVPLLLDFIDGDETNWRLENLQFLCFNCTFLSSKNVFGRKKKNVE